MIVSFLPGVYQIPHASLWRSTTATILLYNSHIRNNLSRHTLFDANYLTKKPEICAHGSPIMHFNSQLSLLFANDKDEKFLLKFTRESALFENSASFLMSTGHFSPNAYHYAHCSKIDKICSEMTKFVLKWQKLFKYFC